MILKSRTTLTCVFALGAVLSQAAPFTPGNIIISRVGDGTAALSNAATAVFLDEYTTNGIFVQTVALPTADSGLNQILTSSGTSTSEGFLALSTNGAVATLVGYDAVVGTAAVGGTTSSTVNRVVGMVLPDGTIDTTTAFDAYNTNSPRSAASVDGTGFWTAGTGSGTGAAATGGVRYIPYGAGQVSTLLSENVTNTRCVKIINGQLYIGTMSGAFRGVSTVGTGIPTTSGQTITLLPGFDPSTTSPQSTYDYAFADATTLYIADDRAIASGGGLQKWTFDGTNWVLQFTISAGLLGTNGIRGLFCVPDAGGAHTLYMTTSEANANYFASMVDTGAGSIIVNVAQAPVNTRFRGLSFAPAQSSQQFTFVPTGQAIVRGRADANNNIANLANDDGVANRYCKFIVTTDPSLFLQLRWTSTSSVLSPTAVTCRVKSKMVHAGLFSQKIEAFNYTTNVYEENRTDSIALAYNTRDLVLTGTLSRYVRQSDGQVNMQVSVRQTGPSTSLFPCADFDLVNWIVNN